MRLAEVLAVSGLAKKAPFHLLPAGSEYQGAHCRFISQAELQIWLNERKRNFRRMSRSGVFICLMFMPVIFTFVNSSIIILVHWLICE